jgi:hypothetical protein
MVLPLLERELKPRANRGVIYCVYFFLHFSGTNLILGELKFLLILYLPLQLSLYFLNLDRKGGTVNFRMYEEFLGRA